MGCSYGITVRRAAGPDLLDSWHASVIEANDLSPRTRQTLRRWDLENRYADAPLDAYARLQAAAVSDPQPDILFALAEISYLLGRRAESSKPNEACSFYYLCAGYAYHYLFDDSPSEPRPLGSGRGGPLAYARGSEEAGMAFDPRFRLACDLYNTGLSKCIRAAQKVGRLDPRQQLLLPTPDNQGFTLSIVHHGFPWQPDEFGPLLFCADYEVVGLANQYRGYGLGVALIGIRNPAADAATNVTTTRSPLRFPHEVSFPVTAFFRFEGSVADLRAQRAGRLELYNPLTVQSVQVQGRPIPLETDMTTPLAYFLSRSDLAEVEYSGLLRADQVTGREGLYAFEPYQPGKIPVVMVHGLLSSPLTWTTMFNDLRADPRLRENYQFWFYLYPTANPYLATAAELRRTLTHVRNQLDPNRRDPALDQMVFVGHSMGGLVCKLLTEDSGDDFWRTASRRPFADLKVRPETRAKLHEMFFFNRQSDVRRVIFISTPHHGSKLGPWPPVQLAARFIHLPKALLKTASEVAKEDPQNWPSLRDAQLATSLDLLAPGAPALELLAARAKPPDVHFHSIIGEAFGKGADGTDGIVPYVSAHLDGVDSEVLVPATHLSVHQHPRAVLEVWRILLDHLHEVRRQTNVADAPNLPGQAILPAGFTAEINPRKN